MIAGKTLKVDVKQFSDEAEKRKNNISKERLR